MLTVSSDALGRYNAAIDAITEEAQAKAVQVLNAIDWGTAGIAECRELVSEALQIICDAYGGASAQAAYEFYNAVRTESLGAPLVNPVSSGLDPAATDGAVRAFVEEIVTNGNVSRFNQLYLSRIGYEMQKAAGNATAALGNADPEKVRFARVPTGAETCDFCMMLASRGFVYHSAKSAGALEHYHDHDKCRIVPGWDIVMDREGPGARGISLSTSYEGYDPDALYGRYMDGEFGKSFVSGGGVKYALNQTKDTLGRVTVNGVSASDVNEVREWLESSETVEELFERQYTALELLAALAKDEKQYGQFYTALKATANHIARIVREREGGITPDKQQ